MQTELSYCIIDVKNAFYDFTGDIFSFLFLAHIVSIVRLTFFVFFVFGYKKEMQSRFSLVL